MTSWWCVYDAVTGFIYEVKTSHLPDSVYDAQGKKQMEVEEGFAPEGLMVDVTQDPPVFIPMPPFPSEAPAPAPSPSPSPQE